MKSFAMKILLLLLVLSLPVSLVSCGGDEADESQVQTSYETEDEEGWSPIWKP